MNIETLKNAIPEHSKDIKLNFASVLTETGAPDLTQNQIGGIALSVAYATKSLELIEAILLEVKNYLSSEELTAAQSAANIMAMNNIYYRFLHLTSDKSFATMPAKLRMNVLANPGIDKVSFELNCLAVSVLNGCGMCVDAHVGELVKAGVSKLGIQSCARIAAVMNAVGGIV